jgi:hypothetical protein
MRGSLLHGQLREHETKESDEEQDYEVRLLPTWFFDNHLYTCRSVLKLELDSETDHVYASMNMSELEATPIAESGWRLLKKYTWVLQHLKPVPRPGSPYEYDARRRSLHFGILTTAGGNHMRQATFANEYWSTVGQGLRGFLKEYCGASGPLKKTVKSITAGITDPRAQIDSIFTYVSSRFHPVSTDLTLQPMHYNLKDLIAAGTGNGFELNVLLSEMLHTAGIPAWPVFINTADRPSYRDLGRFNHAIVLCDLNGELLFLDACFPGCGPGTLPFISRAANGLLVGQERLGACAIGAEPCDDSQGAAAASGAALQ